MSVESTGRVIAVVVTWRPNLAALARLLAAIRPQVAGLVLVDNGSGPALADWLAKSPAGGSVRTLFFGENRGIAAAQNAGIDQAEREGAEYVLLLDQDSLPADNMVALLLAALNRLEAEGCLVAAVGPRHIDPRRPEDSPFVNLEGTRLCRLSCRQGDTLIPVGHLIASGSLIPLRSFRTIGPLVEELFIDYVDIEWCLRAASLGYRSFGVCDALMLHPIGEEPIRFLGKSYRMHDPIRHYYQFRNAVWLCRRPWLSSGWRRVLLIRLPYKLLVYGLIGRPRPACLGMMLLGLWHGLRGWTGRYPDRLSG